MPPESCFAAACCAAEAALPSILLSGISVTRCLSCPLASSAFPVLSLSTTTLKSLAPAITSSAVEAAVSFTCTSLATMPLTRLMSKFFSGALNLKSRRCSPALIFWHFMESSRTAALLAPVSSKSLAAASAS